MSLQRELPKPNSRLQKEESEEDDEEEESEDEDEEIEKKTQSKLYGDKVC